ncbi:TrmH family RNA methyltransferase [Tenacibaculum amylolyticum]|uniref:TrmH family RNA methyltransferase n=1 Tax=Tenacibaculum amylolyticum TaxID=104269 RepID=UPI0038934286
MKKIVSSQNSYIKDLIKLQEKSRERKKKGLFLVEGRREISLVLQSDYVIESVLVLDTVLQNNDTLLEELPKSVQLINVSKEVYQKIAYRDSTEGMIAVVKVKEFSLASLQLTHKNPLIMVMEGIEKPGNIGAMLRTADAANVDAVIIANPKTDIYNPNIIRSSVGCVFTNQIAVDTSENVIDFLIANNIHIYSATLQNSNAYYQEDYTQASAIVVGTEATGLTEIWREKASQNINIPMQGAIDSMNVSVACAIVVFEAKRQRKFIK